MARGTTPPQPSPRKREREHTCRAARTHARQFRIPFSNSRHVRLPASLYELRRDRSLVELRRDMPSHSRGAERPEFAATSRPEKNQRAQGIPDARCTRGLARNVHRKCAHEHQVSGGNPASPAQWLYGLLRALPGERLFCLRSAPRSYCLQVHWRQHRDVRTTRLHRTLSCRSLSALPASTAPRPTFVAIMIRPS